MTFYVPMKEEDQSERFASVLGKRPWFEKIQQVSEHLKEDEYTSIVQITVTNLVKKEVSKLILPPDGAA